MVSPVKAAREGTRTTRQSTTRASTHARPLSTVEDDVVEIPSPVTRSRRGSSSAISSLTPSPQKPTVTLPAPQPIAKLPTATSAPTPTRPSRDKGKGKAIESSLQQGQGEQGRPGRRVLPARIRRAAGGGQEGFRDLEDMIVDWLDRYGYPSDLPPDNLRIIITSLPLEMVDPPVISQLVEVPTQQVTLTPQEAGPSSRRDMIETPDWIKVTSGQDDEEEAREELLLTRSPISPLRRLRRLSSSNEQADDVSDEHYQRLHRRYEAIEKRQRKDERDKLTHERYRMKTRIDLLRSISSGSWSSVVWTVLAREDPSGLWDKGRQAVRTNGIEWLRRRLVKEGVEVMRRYDSMLPVDPRKVKDEKSTGYISESPPPTALPARVAALKSKEADRRKSLPVPQPSQPIPTRKRRKSDSATEQDHASARQMRKPRQALVAETPIIVLGEGEGSDTDSEPLSDAPSESDGEILVEASPSPSNRSISASPGPVVPRQGTRTSTRQPPRKRPSPQRTSARIRVSVGNIPSLPQPTRAEREEEKDFSTPTPDWQSGGFDHKDPELGMSIDNGAYGLSRQIQDQVTLDEQLEMETVEAAVVI